MVTPWLIDHVDNIYASSRQIQWFSIKKIIPNSRNDFGDLHQA